MVKSRYLLKDANGKQINTDERMAGAKIIQKSKVKIQNYKSKVKSFFCFTFEF